MRLHILPDEKVVDRTIMSFEHVFPNDNKYIVLSPNGVCSYVKTVNPNLYVVKYNTDDFWNLIEDASKYNSIIIHYLSKESVSFINRINHNNIYWIEWGADLYNSLLEPKGFKLYTNEKDLVPYLYGNEIKRILKRIRLFFLPPQSILRAIKKVRYFVPDSMYDEYPLLLSYYPQFSHLKYREFFYYPINQVVSEKYRNRQCHGNNIIVGHSGAFTDNHLETLRCLSNAKLDDSIKVKVPLNYGGTEAYRKFVIQQGNALLPKNFLPLTHFLQLDEYNEYLLDASFFIFNNTRQEAVGNILVALYFGGKVFINDVSPLLHFYKKLGLHIFPTSVLKTDNWQEPLSQSEILENRKIINDNYSLERLYQLIAENF